ncbi:MAG: ABC transporter permease [Rhodobacteraceae bacterium]|nr:ABC transporter permease [Paracoccaceae bacterium]
MINYSVSKFLRAVITMLIAVSLVFIFIRFSGDPAAALAPPDASQEVIDQYTEMLGLDKPLWLQYTNYLKGLIQGEFGYSLHTGRAVEDIFLERVPFTLKLGITAFFISLFCGVPLGFYAALNRGSNLDRVVMGFSVFAFAMPNFLFGLLMILIAALWFNAYLGGEAANVLFPAMTLGLASMGSFARFSRSSLLEVINAPYMYAAEARGILFHRRMLFHALPNAAIPLVTLIGLSLGGLIAGSVVTEQVFAWPGVGQLLVRSVATRDLAMVQFIVLSVSFTMVTANLLVDLLYLFIDPRIRVD